MKVPTSIRKIEAQAQALQDQDNWNVLDLGKKSYLLALKEAYKKKTGNALELAYTCPA